MIARWHQLRHKQFSINFIDVFVEYVYRQKGDKAGKSKNERENPTDTRYMGVRMKPRLRKKASFGSLQPESRATGTLPTVRWQQSWMWWFRCQVSVAQWSVERRSTNLKAMGSIPVWGQQVSYLTSVANQAKTVFLYGSTVWKSPIVGIEPATFCSKSAALTTAPRKKNFLK